MRALWNVPLAVLVAAAASSPTPQAPAAAGFVDTVAGKQGLSALRNQYIALNNAGDAVGLAALHADSAGVDIFGVPRLRGRPAIQAAFAADFAARKFTLTEIVPLAQNFRTDADATEIGTYHNMYIVKGATTHEWGRFLGAFSKRADGQWQIVYIMAFPDSIRVDK
jgi:ketosteroid isomerase-like protein